MDLYVKILLLWNFLWVFIFGIAIYKIMNAPKVIIDNEIYLVPKRDRLSVLIALISSQSSLYSNLEEEYELKEIV